MATNKHLAKYKKWAEDNPDTKLAADVTPYSGSATSIGDAAVAADEGRYGDAGLELLGVIPLVKAGMKASKLRQKISKATRAAQAVDRTSDTVSAGETAVQNKVSSMDKPDYLTGGMKKGGKVRSASSRADGCAIRGKTRA